jgi:hypothetical protein
MLEQYPKFEAYLNRFNTHLKEMTADHVKYIRKLSEWQSELRKSTKDLIHEVQVGIKRAEINDENEKIQTLLNYGAISIQLEKAQIKYQTIFHQHIDETNKIFGAYSSHWGNYIESVGVAAALTFLKKDKEIHTSLQKFTRHLNKTRVTIDLLALSETHCYIVDVKNQLKVEHFQAIDKNLYKLRQIAPEYHHLMFQPILVCFHADPFMINYMAENKEVWILRYHGFDKEEPKNMFSWLYQGNG